MSDVIATAWGAWGVGPSTRLQDPYIIFRKDRVVVDALLLVVHVCRTENENDKEEIIRIISAREADKRERRIYFQQADE
jgi:hypothetical protein